MKNTFEYLLISINLIFLVSCKENKKVEPVVNNPIEGNTYPLVVKDEFGFSWPEGLVVDDIIYLDTQEDQLIVSFSKLMISPT
jgi:hypothetical protein